MATLTQNRIEALSTISAWNYVPVIGYFKESYTVYQVEKEIKKLVKDIFNRDTRQHQPAEAPKIVKLIEIHSNLLQEGQTRSYIIVALSIVCILVGFYPIAAALVAFTTAAFAFATSESIRDYQSVIESDLKRGVIPSNILKSLGIKEDACPQNLQ